MDQEDEWRGTALERPDPEEEAEPDLWQEQSQLPLRERNIMWWAGVALPTGLLALGFVALIALVLVG